MGFPQTRLTLIQRLTSGGAEEDWQNFLKDYWGPICRFSLRRGARNLDDAEDVASETFEALWEQRLLVRWVANRSAKLRTLLCCVVRNILSHRNRVRASPSYGVVGVDSLIAKDLRSIFGQSFHYICANSSILRRRRGRGIPRR
ncbi:MAG: hypothetical protein KKE86_04830, partial [Planctomycetes bacterium]|nr:hypothetical protein [Planctomycetota bacterium]MBU4398643.1 hypothetical protein [Planctomycetota bacterium]MCG2684199.1 hypothetical protein [Planctomycetales bacterium]